MVLSDPADSDNSWVITRAVVRGNGHIKLNQPCQDYCDVRLSRDARWLVAAVCDGAGSAKRSDEGARTVAEWVTAKLMGEIPAIEAKGPGPWIKDRVHLILLEARQRLRDLGGDFRDFNCTLVGVLVGPTGGFFFHVGDGAAVSSKAVLQQEGVDGDAVRQLLFLWDQLVVSPPENGEMANETFFVTGDDWDKHLRSTPVPGSTDIVMLMSDGGMEFVLPHLQITPDWITPVIGNLLGTDDDDARGRLVHDYLASPDAAGVTHDDKTLFIAMRRRLLQFAGYPLSHMAPAQAKLPVAEASLEASQPNERPQMEATPDHDLSLLRQQHAATLAGSAASDARSTLALIMAALALLLSIATAVLTLWHRPPPAPSPALGAARPPATADSNPIERGSTAKPPRQSGGEGHESEADTR